jgi:hypothetical protein
MELYVHFPNTSSWRNAYLVIFTNRNIQRLWANKSTNQTSLKNRIIHKKRVNFTAFLAKDRLLLLTCITHGRFVTTRLAIIDKADFAVKIVHMCVTQYNHIQYFFTRLSAFCLEHGSFFLYCTILRISLTIPAPPTIIRTIRSTLIVAEKVAKRWTD